MAGRFDGKVALVTGGGSGIGKATAMEFASEGASVVIADIVTPAAQQTADEIRLRGWHAEAVYADVGDPAGCTRAVQAAIDSFGSLSYLVCAAASFLSRGENALPGDWDHILRVNVRSGALLAAAAAPHMRQAGGGAIVHIASISAHIAQPGRWTYNATKGAVLALTRAQALDFGREGIRVNCVSPGTIWTPQVERETGGDRARVEPILGPHHMLGRVGEPREVARAILFLCSDDASFITGTDLAVDGGYLGKGHDATADAARYEQATQP